MNYREALLFMMKIGARTLKIVDLHKQFLYWSTKQKYHFFISLRTINLLTLQLYLCLWLFKKLMRVVNNMIFLMVISHKTHTHIITHTNTGIHTDKNTHRHM